MAKVMPGCRPQSEPRGISESSTSKGLLSRSRTWEVLQPPLIWLNFFLNDGLNHNIRGTDWGELNLVVKAKQAECGITDLLPLDPPMIPYGQIVDSAGVSCKTSVGRRFPKITGFAKRIFVKERNRQTSRAAALSIAIKHRKPEMKKAVIIHGLCGLLKKSYFTSVLQNRSIRSRPFSMLAMLVA